MSSFIPEFLVCPNCRGRLFASVPEEQANDAEGDKELICPHCSRAFAVKVHIPMMVPHDARKLSEAETLSWQSKARALSGQGPNAETAGDLS